MIGLNANSATPPTLLFFSSPHLMVAALEAAGAQPKASDYPDVTHNSWTRTDHNPEVIKWLFSQHRK